MITQTDPHIEREVITVDDGLYAVDLTVERAILNLPLDIRDEYAKVYRWFQEGDGAIEPKGLGTRIPGVSIPHTAQRGIHKPAHQDYALSITVTNNGFYTQDKDLVWLPDGTWLLVYSAQINHKGNETQATYNESLVRCLNDGIPVGVFLQRGATGYERHLAFVERYDPFDNTFTLHGPVLPRTEELFASPARQVDPSIFKSIDTSDIDLSRDTRSYETVRAVRRKGQETFRTKLLDAYDAQCAVTSCAVPETLQAAHISPYRGKHTNVTWNGLLLRADLHLLYDAHLMSVDPERHRVHVSEMVDYPEYRAMEHRVIRAAHGIPADRQDSLLDVHYQEFSRREEARALETVS